MVFVKLQTEERVNNDQKKFINQEQNSLFNRSINQYDEFALFAYKFGGLDYISYEFKTTDSTINCFK